MSKKKLLEKVQKLVDQGGYGSPGCGHIGGYIKSTEVRRFTAA